MKLPIRMNNRPRQGWGTAARAAVFILIIIVPAALATGVQDTPVTFYQWTVDPAPALDPQSGEGQGDIIANLFLPLTGYDPVEAEVRPSLATAWEMSEDGRVFTFTLRDDVYWVRYDIGTKITARVRAVTAYDFVAGFQRTCMAEDSLLSALLADIVVGCDALAASRPGVLNAEALSVLKVSAPTSRTLTVELKRAASWFLSLTPAIRPAPADVIERYGVAWTLPDHLVTTGPFVLTQYTPGQRLVMVRANTHLPSDLQGPGNVQRVVYDVVRDINAGFSLYLSYKADVSLLPAAEVAGFVGQRPGEAVLLSDQHVAYLGFVNNRAPFNDVRVRRAFAAALDREAFTTQVLNNSGLPAMHLTPPEAVGAPVIDQIGMRYDPEFARAAFAEAGYRGCASFPFVTLLAHQSTIRWVEFMVESWSEVLSCDQSVFKVELVDFSELLARTGPNASYAELPHLFTLVWRGEYPDAHGWVGELLHCETGPRTRRVCSAVDDLIIRAATSDSLAERRALYAQIEADFFGPEGSMPLVPLYQQGRWLAVKPWIELPAQFTGGLATVGQVHWDHVVIDSDLQTSCRRKDAGPAECDAPLVPLPTPVTPTDTPLVSATPTALSTPHTTAQPNSELGDISIPVTPTPTLSGRPPDPPPGD